MSEKYQDIIEKMGRHGYILTQIGGCFAIGHDNGRCGISILEMGEFVAARQIEKLKDIGVVGELWVTGSPGKSAIKIDPYLNKNIAIFAEAKLQAQKEYPLDIRKQNTLRNELAESMGLSKNDIMKLTIESKTSHSIDR